MQKTPAQLAAMKALAKAAAELANMVAEDLDYSSAFEEMEQDGVPAQEQANQLAGGVILIQPKVEQLRQLLAAIETLHKV